MLSYIGESMPTLTEGASGQQKSRDELRQDCPAQAREQGLDLTTLTASIRGQWVELMDCVHCVSDKFLDSESNRARIRELVAEQERIITGLKARETEAGKQKHPVQRVTSMNTDRIEQLKEDPAALRAMALGFLFDWLSSERLRQSPRLPRRCWGAPSEAVSNQRAGMTKRPRSWRKLVLDWPHKLGYSGSRRAVGLDEHGVRSTAAKNACGLTGL